MALWFLLSAAAVAALYVGSAYPGLASYRDAGDLAAGAWTLGVAHPPGYPLYVLLGRAWTALLPFGSAAFRLNVLSAVAAGLAAGLTGWAAARATRSAAAFWAVTALAAAPAFWHLGTLSEMYALNGLFGAALLALAACEGPRPVLAGALLMGLACGNHQTVLALAPGLAWAASGRLTRRQWLWAAGLFLLGAAVFLYLPVRAASQPWLDWGDPTTPARLWRVLTRGDYGGVRLHPERPMGLTSPALWASGARLSAEVFWRELGAAGAGLALWGAWAARKTSLRRVLLPGFLLGGPLFVVWANLEPGRPETMAILEPHLVLPLVCAAALSGLGAVELARRWPSRAGAAVLAALALAGLWQRRADAAALAGHRGDYAAWDYGTALAAGLPKGALILDPDDPTAFTLSYLSAAHARRADVTPLLYFRTRWGYELLRRRRPELLPARDIVSGRELQDALVSHNLAAGRPLYVDLPQKAPPGAPLLPEGLAYRLLAAPPDAARRAAALERGSAAFRVLNVRRPRSDAGFFSLHAAAYWSSALNNAAIEAERAGRPAEAERLYARALAFDPALPQAWNNWANAALARGDAAAAEGRYRAALRERDDPGVRYNLARAYLTANRLPEAEAEYRTVVAQGGPIEAANDLGLVHLRAGRLDEAERAFLEVARSQPRFPLSYYNLGVLYEKQGKRAAAAEAVRAWAMTSGSPEDRREAEAWSRRLQNR
ncbi:DUF2723 domain-containing protein [bacterium]|nr:MAG: DUF2723 domain-containing protein [bacterium]